MLLIRHTTLPAIAALISLGYPSLRAAEATPAAPAHDTETRKIDGIFNTDLPKTERKGSIRLIVHPHFGDLTNRSYIRIPTGIRWGVNDHVELTGTVEPYLAHGLKHGSPGYGIGDVQFGAKYAFRLWLKPDYDASAGINIRIPVGSPPVDMTDGYNHYSPYLVIAHDVASQPGLKVFFSPSVDLMDKSSVAGTFRKNDPHSSSVTLSGGFVYDRFPLHYTFESGIQTTSLIGRDNKQFFFVRPGLAWDIPRKFTFNSRGRWLIGLGIKVTFGPDGTRTDGGGKLRAEFGVTRWFHRNKKVPEDGGSR